MAEPLRVSTLIRLLEEQVDHNALVQIEVDTQYELTFYNARLIPIRYAPSGDAVVTLRTTNRVDE